MKKWYIGLSGEILPIDDEVQENVKKVVTTNPQLIDFHKVKSSGDAFLIATAMKYGLTVITEESKLIAMPVAALIITNTASFKEKEPVRVGIVALPPRTCGHLFSA